MKKFSIILVMCLLAVLPLQAQFAKPLKSMGYAHQNGSRFCIGLTGSYAANDMIYTAMKADEFHVFLSPTFGVAAEYNIMQDFAVGLDASYVMRGTLESTSTTFLTNFSTTTSARVNYEMSLSGVEMRLPVTLYLGDSESVKPYVYLAPRVSLWLGDSIRWKRTYDDESYAPLVYKQAVDKSTMRPYDVSVVAGFGLCGRLMLGQMPLYVKLDLNYGISVLNTFSDEEVTASNGGTAPFVFHGWGDILHEELGRRHLQNAEARLTILVPIKKHLKDACSFDQRLKKTRK